MPDLTIFFLIMSLVSGSALLFSKIVSEKEKYRFDLDRTLNAKVSACASELGINKTELITESLLAFLSIQKLKRDDRIDAFYAEGDDQELNITKWFSIGHNYRRRSGDEQCEDDE